jgi:hypothetical protein
MVYSHLIQLKREGVFPINTRFHHVGGLPNSLSPLQIFPQTKRSYETTLNVELIRPAMRVDKALQVVYDGGKCIVHVEFQTNFDRHFHPRLLMYNAMLYHDSEGVQGDASSPAGRGVSPHKSLFFMRRLRRRERYI